MLFICAKRSKMLDKSVPFIIGHVLPETMDRVKACPMGDFPGALGITYLWFLSEMWAHPSRALIKWAGGERRSLRRRSRLFLMSQPFG